MKGKHLVIVNQSSGYLTYDIAEAYKNKGYNVTLITASSECDIKGVCTEKIVKYTRSSSVMRVVTWMLATIQIFFKILLKYRSSELLIISNPPTAPLLPILPPNCYSLLIFDIYPDVLINQEFIGENNPIAIIWRKINCHVFRKAKKIFTISEGMRNCLIKYAHGRIIRVNHLWSNKSLAYVDFESNLFIKAYHLEKKFIIMYSGNLGNTHPLEILVDLAKEIDDREIQFIIIGEGEKKKIIAEKIQKYHCENVMLLPYQSSEMLSHSLSSIDIAVVTLDSRSSLMSVPSKTYNLIKIGRPIMCIAKSNSELSDIIKKYRIGEIFNQEELIEMKEFILKLKGDKNIWNFYHRNSLDSSRLFTHKNAYLFVDE